MNGVPGVKVMRFFDTRRPPTTMVAREISFLGGLESRFESTLAIVSQLTESLS